MAFNEKGRGNLRNLVESQGSQAVAKILEDAINKDEIKPSEFSIKELFEAFVTRDVQEAVGTGDFVKITGALINKAVIDGYEGAVGIGDQLVTTIPGKLKKETITGFTALLYPQQVPEGKDYESSGFEEKYVTVQSLKYGRIVGITEEMIQGDQTHSVIIRAKTLGERCKDMKEKLIVQGVIDVNSTVWRPSDSPLALYANASTTTAHDADNLAASNPFGASGLSAIEKLAHAMTDDSHEKNYIGVSLIGKPLLVPVDLMEEAWELSATPTHPETAERASNYWKGKFVPMTSPWITANSSSTWYWGDFRRDFVWVDIFPLQTLVEKPGAPSAFDSDVPFRFKVRLFGGIGAIDFRHVFRATA